MLLEAVIFDLDGLICDTEGCYYAATAEICRRHGVDLTLEDWATTAGWAEADRWLDRLEAEVGEALPREELMQLRTGLDAECRSHLTPLPGVVPLMAEIRHAHLRVGVVSHASTMWIQEHLERLGIDGMVDALTGSEVVAERPPAPDLYEAMLAELEVAPADALAVEDSQLGVIAAGAFGLACLAVPNPITNFTDLSRADAIVESLEGVGLADLRTVHRIHHDQPRPTADERSA